MKNTLWIIAFSIVQVLVNCQSFGNTGSYYQNVPQQQLQHSSGLSGLGTQSFYQSTPAVQFGSEFSSGQFGLSPLQYQSSAPYQRPVEFKQGFQPSQPFQLPSSYQSLPLQPFNPFNSFALRANPVGGRSAHRSGRLQHLHTKAIPSGSFNQPGGYTPAVNIGQQLSGNLLTPLNSYFAPSPSPAVSATSPLPAFRANLPKQIFPSSPTFSMSSSIPFAEGHSFGNNIAYTFNTGLGSSFGTAAPQTLPFQSYSYQSPSAFSSYQASPALSTEGINAFSTGGQGFDLNYGLSNSHGYGEYSTDFFSNLYKRDSKLKSSTSHSKSIDKSKIKKKNS